MGGFEYTRADTENAKKGNNTTTSTKIKKKLLVQDIK